MATRNSQLDTRNSLRVYHDGTCPFCLWAQSKVERYDADHRVEFRDYHQHGSETPFPFADLDRAMHVQTPDGRWHIGFLGWLEILRVLPGWRSLARLMSVPPLRWIGPLLYRFVAGNRYRIPKFLLRFLGAPAPCGPACDLPR
jgi:predicted DCC family thiol-disulfide oxidoreductase YuxK